MRHLIITTIRALEYIGRRVPGLRARGLQGDRQRVAGEHLHRDAVVLERRNQLLGVWLSPALTFPVACEWPGAR
jgi:hypothetical protein